MRLHRLQPLRHAATPATINRRTRLSQRPETELDPPPSSQRSCHEHGHRVPHRFQTLSHFHKRPLSHPRSRTFTTTATFLQQSHRVELVTRRRVRAVNKVHLPICGEGRRRREHMSCAASSPHDSTSLPQHAHVLCVLLGNSLCTGTDSRCLAASPRSTGDRPRRRRPGAANTRPHSRAAGRPAGWATWAGSLRGAVVSDCGTRRRTQEQAGRQVGG